jgi:benzoate-CoA ligase
VNAHGTEATRNFGHYLLDRDLAQTTDRTALVTADRRWTYGELASLSNQAGNALRGAGIGLEDRVLLALNDTVETVAMMIGAFKIGAVVVPISPWLSGVEYGFLISDSRCKAVIATVDAAELVRPLIQGDPRCRLIVAGSQDANDIVLSAFIAAGDPMLGAPPTRNDDAAVWHYTSGSTGRPKAVIHTHTQLAALADYPRERMDLRPDDVVMCVAKLFVAYGMGLMATALLAGASYCLVDGRPSPMVVATSIQEFRPTLFGGLPANYAGMLAVPMLNLASVRACLSAGDRLSGELAEAWRAKTGLSLINLLASTETFAPLLTSSIRSGSPERLEVADGYEIRLIDEADSAITGEGSGDLLVRGPTVFNRYWMNDALTQTTVLGEWVRTGDRCRRNADGTFEYVGRADEMFKSGGQWVDPVIIETAVNRHPVVLESGVVGRSDRSGVVVPAAYVVLRPGVGDLSLEELREHLSGRLGPHEMPRSLTLLEALPKTPGGKIRRFLLGAS